MNKLKLHPNCYKPACLKRKTQCDICKAFNARSIGEKGGMVVEQKTSKYYKPHPKIITHKSVKECINCGEKYGVKKVFFERSKYCSRSCLVTHKAELRKTRKMEEKKAKTIARQPKLLEKRYAKARKDRERKLQKTTVANKAIAFMDNGHGEFKFGDDFLTLKNYKEPLARIPQEKGIGWYGTLAAEVKTGKIQCHLCGDLFDVLPGHIWMTHKMKIREYREMFGLQYTTALVSEQQRMRLKEETLSWLKSMTPEEKEEHKRKLRENGKKYAMERRGNFQPKKTLEAMNKDGSCPDQTLQQIIDMKNEIGHIPTKGEFVELKGSQRFVHLVYKHFGSWKKAIEMCNFASIDEKESVNKGAHVKRYTDEELLEYLRIYTQEYQQVPTASDWKRDLLPTHDTYIRHFGSIEEARQLAGVYEIVEKSKTLLTRSKHYRKIYKRDGILPA